jgi:hypothetical protein
MLDVFLLFELLCSRSYTNDRIYLVYQFYRLSSKRI